MKNEKITNTSADFVELLRDIENQKISVDECFKFEPIISDHIHVTSVDIFLTDFAYNFLKEKNEFFNRI